MPTSISKKMEAPLLIQVCLTLVVQILGALHKSCPSSKWTHHGNNCYIIPDGAYLSWADGRKLCQSLGGDMVLPQSPEETDFIYQTAFSVYENPADNIWIHCYFEDGQWDCGKDPDEYTNFSTIHPKIENCLIMIMDGYGKTHGLSCAEPRRVVCQRSQRSVSISALTCSAIPHGQPRCLADHTLTEFRVRIPVQCCIACSRDPTCRSFNMKGDMCQLNNVIASEVNGDYFNIVPDCAYYEYE